MKKLQLFFTVAAIGIANAAFGQTDTVFTTISQEPGALATQQYSNETERAFNFLTPAKWMFKADLGYSLFNLFDDPGIRISAETKLSEALSISANVQYDLESGRLTSREQLRLGTTIRWYYDMKKRIAAGKSASNFSGNYLALEPSWLRGKESNYTNSGVELIAKFGIQRRLLRHGYFDLSYGLGVRHNQTSPYSRGGWYLSTRPQVSMGLALFSPKKKDMPVGEVCDVIRCFQETRRMFKIDLYNLLNVTAFPTHGTSFSFNPSVAYEQKIGGSPFSAEFSLAGSSALYAFNTGFPGPIKVNAIGGGGMVELRWYFLQKKRMLEGKSGNNLSGVFWGVHAGYGATRSHFTQIGNNSDGTSNTQYVRSVLGVQHRILNRGFVQFKIGAGAFQRQSNIMYQDGREINGKAGPSLDIYGELKAGLAF